MSQSAAPTELQVGPEMDAEIARRVFGCALQSEFTDGEWHHYCHCDYGWHNDPDLDRPGLWRFSKDIQGAWLAVENMAAIGWTFSAVYSNRETLAHFSKGDAVAHRTESTAPFAICRAALAALEAGCCTLTKPRHIIVTW